MSNHPAFDKLPDLSDLFARFAAYSKQQAAAGAYDHPMGVSPEDNEVNKHYEIELQKNNEDRQHY